MKFIGLIVMCASSCLSLILPAFGLVQFPKGIGSVRSHVYVSHTASTGHTQQPDLNRPMAQDRQSSMDVLPGTFTSSTVPPANYFPPNNQPLADAQPSTTTIYSPSQPGLETGPTGIRLGMGLWLLLMPICLTGLVLWSIAPNPSAGKK
jgi:hypothetical protein